MQAPEPERAKAAFAIGLHIIREGRIGEKRHMAEDVMKDVGLLKIVELVGAANEIGGGKTPMREMVEENRVRHEARNRCDAPARERGEALVQAAKVGNARAMKIKRVEPMQKGVAGAPGKDLGLAVVKRNPDAMLGRVIGVEPLWNRPIRSGPRRRLVDCVEALHGFGSGCRPVLALRGRPRSARTNHI